MDERDLSRTTYDLAGRTVSMDEESTIAYSYSGRRGIEVGTTSNPDADHEIAYGYDSTGRLNSVTDPQDTWTYSFVLKSNLLAQTASSATTVTTVLYSLRKQPRRAYIHRKQSWHDHGFRVCICCEPKRLGGVETD